MKPLSNPYLKIAKLGAVAGMRSMIAINLLSNYVAKTDAKVFKDTPLSILKNPAANAALKVAAAGEMLADKVPFTPARISAPPLLWRIVWGAVLGAVLTLGRHKPDPVPAALVGGGAALVTTYLAYHLRVQAAERLHIPDVVLGAAEDALVFALSANVAQEIK
jgi:uncharacterized membrane protein